MTTVPEGLAHIGHVPLPKSPGPSQGRVLRYTVGGDEELAGYPRKPPMPILSLRAGSACAAGGGEVALSGSGSYMNQSPPHPARKPAVPDAPGPVKREPATDCR